ncbi:hypothetical protein CRV15_30610 (plasmid) [Streptomyces clavuligerus]|uniref:hypothetical protein n=1 Tax=Streptomyces clavuligerus TaxID=1901 RepID=UPI00017FF675|nr:hypothetical protein [Streptomyces clavuligerus]EDY48907.1 hypothetical protein SSCG_01935 [Streptomyces clavuligerus]MBY6307499.1 hypothetical protein [Streptomyces clavuligerus]QCS09942.1 hypothetical protein CRV15_30610 [Streptomyces clavuligerus]QPJ98012.1 hypothetical protein GE265_33825 [Streptomyces clavuligerus]WDN56650.1 hypothetical protein LL058_33055 [Streptomyces clavuligerus]
MGRAGRLNARFAEGTQDLSRGWVTGTPGPGHPTQLAALGDGAVPQRAARALERLAPPLGHCPHQAR